MDLITGTISAIARAPFILVGWLIIGAVAGELARRFMGSQDQGCLSDWILGIAGSFIGGFIASFIGLGGPERGLGGFIMNIIVATVGAVAIIFLRRAITGQGAPPPPSS